MAKAIRNDAQLKKVWYCPKKDNCGNGINQTKPNKLNTIKGTQTQWISLLVPSWWLSAYLSNKMSTGFFTGACAVLFISGDFEMIKIRKAIEFYRF